jgi:rhodanese-related sulfurtransferase
MSPRRLLLPLAALALSLGAARASGEEPYGSLSMDQVERDLGKPGFHVYDANVPELWQKYHLPGAVHVAGKDLARLLPPEKGARLVFYCTNPR